MYLSLSSSFGVLAFEVLVLIVRDPFLGGLSEPGALRPVVIELPPNGVETRVAVLLMIPECSLLVSKMSLESEPCTPHYTLFSWHPRQVIVIETKHMLMIVVMVATSNSSNIKPCVRDLLPCSSKAMRAWAAYRCELAAGVVSSVICIEHGHRHHYITHARNHKSCHYIGRVRNGSCAFSNPHTPKKRKKLKKELG